MFSIVQVRPLSVHRIQGSLSYPTLVFPGTLRAFHSGRISYCNKLSGPSIATDTACSSSLVSIYHACRALQSGDCTAAIAGGVNTISSPDVRLSPNTPTCRC